MGKKKQQIMADIQLLEDKNAELRNALSDTVQNMMYRAGAVEAQIQEFARRAGIEPPAMLPLVIPAVVLQLVGAELMADGGFRLLKLSERSEMSVDEAIVRDIEHAGQVHTASPDDNADVESVNDVVHSMAAHRLETIGTQAAMNANMRSGGKWHTSAELADVIVIANNGKIGVIRYSPGELLLYCWPSCADFMSGDDGVIVPGYEPAKGDTIDVLAEAAVYLGNQLILTGPGTKTFVVDVTISMHGEMPGHSIDQLQQYVQGMHWPGLFTKLNPHNLQVHVREKF